MEGSGILPWMFSGDSVQERRRRSSANSGTVWYAYRVANCAKMFRGRSVVEHLMGRAGPSRARVRLESTGSSRTTATVLGEVRLDVDVYQAAGVAQMSWTCRPTVRAEFLLDQVLNTSVRMLRRTTGNTVTVAAAFQKIVSSFAKRFILAVMFRKG